MDTVLMEEMTSPDIKAAIAAGRNVVVFACASTEQHGPHLPLGSDAYMGTAIAERAARIARNSLVAPTLRPGLSEHHMQFAGSMTVRPETFLALVSDYLTSLATHGFRRIVMFASHGGNSDLMRAQAPYLARPLKGTCEVRFSTKSSRDMDRTREFLRSVDVRPGEAGFHAGLSETAGMLAVRPDLVRPDRAAPGRDDDIFYQPDVLQRSMLELFLHGVGVQSPNGVMGDPRRATADIGETLIQHAAESLARDLVDAS